MANAGSNPYYSTITQLLIRIKHRMGRFLPCLHGKNKTG